MISYHARWVLPISGPPIPSGCVTVHQGRIVYVGPFSTAPTVELRDLGNCVLMPGLVNAHTHLELTAMRGFLEDLAFGPWIRRLTNARNAVLDRERLLASSILGIAEGLRAGVTTYADTSASGVVHEALRSMHVRGIMYQEVFGPHRDQAESAAAELKVRVAECRKSDTPLVRTGVSPHAPFSVSDALFSATAEFARSESLPVAVHIAESDAELQLVKSGTGPFADAWRARGITPEPRAESPVALLDALGVLRTRPLLIHCIRVRGVDMARIREAGCGVVHCPASNAKLGHGVAPLLEMLELGIHVGIGTDSVASNNRMDLLDEARLAVLMQRARLGSHSAVGARKAIELATLGGARAMGLSAEIGSLEVGKAADMVAFPLEGDRDAPAFDPENNLLFAQAGRPARFVYVAGQELVRNGELKAEVSDARSIVAASASAIAEWMREAEQS